MKKRKKKKSISRIINVISIIVLTIFLLVLYQANILPIKYFKIIGISLVLFELIHTLLCVNKKFKGKKLLILNVIVLLLVGLEVFATIKISETMNFLKINLDNSYKTEVYYFVANKESGYEELGDIEDENVYFYVDLKNVKQLKENIKEKITIKLKTVDTMSDLINELDNDNIILINSGSYESLTENYEKYKDSTVVIDEVTLKIKTEKVEIKKNITKDPFVIYLSGIDTRSDYLPSRSLSDVNMLVVVNPNTRKILLVHVPRDYYVQIHDTEGLKDKLTHAGSMGGVELSKATMEDLFGIKVDYYMRVNFNAVVNLIDAIGGIPIYSDVDYTFSCWTNRNCVFVPGDNYVYGDCALAFARERHAYNTGDRHRGENQQQVIKQVVNKLTSSPSLITNYTDILNALSGSFESSLSSEDITSLVQFQLNDMSGWNIENSNLEGTGGHEPTYSYPYESLYVMYPIDASIETAKTRINEVLNEK